MARGQKKIVGKCQRHNFSLKPKSHQCHFVQNITACFCEKEFDKYKSKSNQKQENICLNCPIFNKDKNYATPTFILSCQSNHFMENGLKLKEEHEKKVEQYTDSKTQIWQPKPRSKHSYCSVCKENYQEYRDHITSSKHKKKINNSIFNKHIQELIDKINPNNKHQEKEQVINLITSPTNPTDQQYQSNLRSQPRKRIKPDMYMIPPPPPPNFNYPYYNVPGFYPPGLIEYYNNQFKPRFAQQMMMTQNPWCFPPPPQIQQYFSFYPKPAPECIVLDDD